MSIDQADKGLARYYASLGVKDYNEKFKEWCEENGLGDDDDIKEELDQEPSECQLVDFDEKFPLPINQNQSEAERLRQIYNIIKCCWNDPNAYKDGKNKQMPTSKLSDPNTFDVPQEQKQLWRDIYATQCPAIYKSGTEDDTSFLTSLIIGRLHKVEYVQHLFDLYMRDSIENCKAKRGILHLPEWTKQHPYFAQLNKNPQPLKHIGKNPAEIAEAAIKSFGARICPKLLFNTTTKIQDSFEETTKYICEAVEFVTKLADRRKDTCPFQVDVCIAFPRTIGSQQTVDINPDDDDDDEDADDYGDKDTEQKMDFVDCIGDIKAKLKANNLQYLTFQQEDAKPTRIMGTLFEEFNKKIKSDKYPHRKRFITFVDRRQLMDKVIMFEAPQDVRDIPADAVPEWYFNSSKTCIIPNIEEKVMGKNDDEPMATTMQNEIINSGSACQGALITLSFHVKEIDSIKCYLYFNGQIMRFLPDDILDILPLFFDMEFADNVWFGQDSVIKDHVIQDDVEDDVRQVIKARINDVKDKLVDREFSAFENAFKNQCL